MRPENFHHVTPLKTYYAVFTALVVGTIATYLTAIRDFGPLNNVIALGIACTKAALVIVFFMHVKYSSKLVWCFAAAGFVWLLIMFALTLADYFWRAPGW